MFGYSTSTIEVRNMQTGKLIKEDLDQGSITRLTARFSNWNDLLKNVQPHPRQPPMDMNKLEKFTKNFSLEYLDSSSGKYVKNCTCELGYNKEDPGKLWILDGQHRYSIAKLVFNKYNADLLYEFNIVIVENQKALDAEFEKYCPTLIPVTTVPQQTPPQTPRPSTKTSRMAEKKNTGVPIIQQAQEVVKKLQEIFPKTFRDTGVKTRDFVSMPTAIEHLSGSSVFSRGMTIDQIVDRVLAINEEYLQRGRDKDVEFFKTIGNNSKTDAMKFIDNGLKPDRNCLLGMDKQYKWIENI